MKALLKNIPLILLVFGTAACGVLNLEPLIRVPTTPTDEPFPKKGSIVIMGRYTLSYAERCLRGEYTGEKIPGKSTGGTLWVNHIDPSKFDFSKSGRPNPNGKGKIYEYYLTYDIEPPPLSADINAPWGRDKWGYSFTFFTTDEDIVTDCKVTKRLLRRW
jgi:hypothetical protein